MSEGGYKIRNQQGLHFITFAVVEWIDVFTRSMYSDIVVDSLKYCIRKKGLKLHAWIIMSNHIHLVASANENFMLSEILRDLKKFTSKKILDSIRNNELESRRKWMMRLFKEAGKSNSRNETFQFWRQENRPIELDDNKMIEQRIDYLHRNPVASGWIDDETDFIYSSARDYAGEKGLIKLDILK